jgi:hypothetical protein
MGLFRRKPPVEFKRKCSDCGYSWYLSAQERDMGAPNSLQINGLMHSVGARLQIGLGYQRPKLARGGHLARLEARRPRLEAQRARVAEINSCRECGSVLFTEWRVQTPLSSS